MDSDNFYGIITWINTLHATNCHFHTLRTPIPAISHFLWFGFKPEYFFLNVYISENTIFDCSYLFFWLRNRLSIKYVHNWGNGGGSFKMCADAYRGRGVEKLVIRYVHNAVEYVLCIGLVKYTIASPPARKCCCFLPS